MLYRTKSNSTRALVQLAGTMLFLVTITGIAAAAPPPPLLVPYTVNTVAGDPLYPSGLSTTVAGYAGENVPATRTSTNPGATLNTPATAVVDSAGNIYIADTANDIIREVNAQTGLITTVAGFIPTGCSGTNCSIKKFGCDDGVPAKAHLIGPKTTGLAVDGYGNLYILDSTQATVSVIFRGGSRVANFIQLEDPAGVATAGGVLPGYIYHVAGTIDLSSCSATTGSTDNALAFQNTSMRFTQDGRISLDGAGNIYIGDTSNSTVRVINTQATPQTFFQYEVQPGYMRSITNCNAALTTPCPTSPVTSTANTGINGPVNAIVFQSQYKSASADAYGNVYQLNGTGNGTLPPGIYAAVAYAGGPPLTNLLTAEQPLLQSYFPYPNPPLQYGNSYSGIDNPAVPGSLPGWYSDLLANTPSSLDIRPSDLRPDNFGTFWFSDNHYPYIMRIDQYTSLATGIIGSTAQRATANVAGIYSAPASFSNPWYCVYGNSSGPNPWTQGPQTYDPEGDGCPAIVGRIGANNTVVSDSLGNIIMPDTQQLIRELTIGTQFKNAAVGTQSPVTLPIQVHFNSANPPHDIGAQIPDGPAMTGYTTSGTFSISGETSDFSIDTTTPEFPLGSLINSASSNSSYGSSSTTPNFKMWAGLPTCTQLGAAPNPTSVQDFDCLVYVKFTPTQPGLRQAQLVVTTQNGFKYNFQLTGLGTGGQIAVDGGMPSTVPSSGLGATNSVAVDGAGNVYVADPANNRIVVEPAGNGTQQALAISGATLSGPKGVALDSANNIYIADTGNNRVLKVDANSGVASVLGNNLWIPGPDKNPPPPQYAFKAPQGLAVDAWGNVYVADTGNKAVVEIPANVALGGAVNLFDYAGAPKFVNPIAIAVDSVGNVYVADTGNSSAQIVELGPGGGDLINVPGTQFANLKGQNLISPNSVAVDGAGNVYVSDSSQNQVFVFPAGSGSAAAPYALNLPGLNTPAGLALDANGNLYIADSGNKRILFENRQNPLVDFGTVPQSPTSVPTQVLTVLNIGTQSVGLVSPFTSVTSVSPSNSTAFSLTNTSCNGSLISGTACTLNATFNPSFNGGQAENVSLNGGTQTLQLTANGISPLAIVSLSASYSSGSTPTAGATATITATVTQPHVSNHIPSGSVTFTYAIDSNAPAYYSCGSGGTQTVTLDGSGAASFQLPTLAQGLNYKITATYAPDSGDPADSANSAAPLLIQVPGIQVAASASSISFTYGQAPPAITGTISPALPTGVTADFQSAASATTAVGTYPIQVFFKGPNSCAYGFPTVLTSSGTPATVTENKAPLSYKIPNFTTTYGAPAITYGAQAVITGIVNGDTVSATFTPPDSSVLNVGTYPIVPTVTGAHIGNYTVTAPPATLVVSQASPSVAAGSPQTLVVNTTAGVTSAPYSISVVAPGKGIPTGAITVLDNFTPITAGAPGTGTVVPACSIPFVGAITNGSANVTGIGGNFGLATGQAVTGAGIPSGATISAVNSGGLTLSANATATSPAVVLTAASGVTPCNPPITINLAAGSATYTPSSTTSGIHQYSFIYNGDSNFTPSESAVNTSASGCKPTSVASQCLVVDAPDFALTTTTGVVQIIPGTTPSGNGLPAAANQSAAAPESAVINISGFLNFGSTQPGFTVALSCTTQNPSYVSCSMTPPAVCVGNCPNTSGGFTTVNSTASVLSVSTPATLPLGFFSSSNVRTSTTRTVLAFAPFGVLAFCVRRRRRLSKLLWVLIGVAAIGAAMQGCGGNQVNFYTPVPTGPQTVTVTGSFTGGGTTPSETRSIVVPINIQ